MLYTLILFAHIMSAILSIGPFFVLIPLLKRMEGVAENVLEAQIQTFRSAIRLVKHAGHVLVASGVLMIWLGYWPWSTSWIVMTLAIMFASVFFLARAFKPTLKKFESPGADRKILIEKLNRSVWVYIFLLLVMLWLMVAKPQLW